MSYIIYHVLWKIKIVTYGLQLSKRIRRACFSLMRIAEGNFNFNGLRHYLTYKTGTNPEKSLYIYLPGNNCQPKLSFILHTSSIYLPFCLKYFKENSRYYVISGLSISVWISKDIIVPENNTNVVAKKINNNSKFIFNISACLKMSILQFIWIEIQAGLLIFSMSSKFNPLLVWLLLA